ncbi:hypothetical protein VNO80_18863 [Phaseolus coccineus]|uniref:Uncharacterized protein n=1 Tax=Phaseolus coccineus TaxID=3886 RepID=A0AAN9MF48_PHACN
MALKVGLSRLLYNYLLAMGAVPKFLAQQMGGWSQALLLNSRPGQLVLCTILGDRNMDGRVDYPVSPGCG